jgi:hypothetical protein
VHTTHVPSGQYGSDQTLRAQASPNQSKASAARQQIMEESQQYKDSLSRDSRRHARDFSDTNSRSKDQGRGKKGCSVM